MFKNVVSINFFTGAILLGGCTHTNTDLAVSMAKDAEIAYKADGSLDDLTCQKLGFKPSTTQYGQCRNNEDLLTEYRIEKAQSASEIEKAEYDQTCQRYGFKPIATEYDQCMQTEENLQRTAELKRQADTLEADRIRQEKIAESNRTESERIVREGDGSPDDQTCQKYGFKPSTMEYGQCRQTFDMARRELERQERVYAAEQQLYQEKLAEYEKEKARQESLRLMRFGAALMSGTSPYFSENFANAGRIVSGQAPIPPSFTKIQTYSVQLPGNQLMLCSLVNNYFTCF
jgi:hypothetical protein